MNVKEIIDGIIAVEKGYVNDPNDSGGATCWGITERVARANGYVGEMSALTKEFAYQVYLQQYFIAPQFDKVATLSEVVAQELCDIAVNMGPSVACPMLQESLNLLNRGQQDYLDMQVDGHIGKETLMALAAFLVKRGADGEKVLGRMLYIMKGERYITLAKAKPSQENFLFGWILNRVGI